MARRRNDTQSASKIIILLVVFLGSIAFLGWLPLRRATRGTLVPGVVGIIGGLASLSWWVGAHDAPPVELKLLAAASGGLYAVALVLRILLGPRDEFEAIERADVASLSLRRDEVVLYEGGAKFLADRRKPLHLGISFPIAGRFRGGVGTTIPITSLHVIDQGTLVVTSRSVVLLGERGTRTLKGRRILQVTADDNHVFIRPVQGVMIVAAVREPQAVLEAIQSLVELS